MYSAKQPTGPRTIGQLVLLKKGPRQKTFRRVTSDTPAIQTKELSWLTIKQLVHTETLKIISKALHNEAPEYLKELFHRLSDTQNSELRNSKTDFHIPLLRTSCGRNSFVYSGACIWNNLQIKQKQVNRSPP